METTTQKDRILKFKDYMGMSMRSFESRIGVSNGYFKSLQKKPSTRILECIFNAFPNLSRMWVLTGTGEMLITQGNYSVSSVEIGSHNTNSNIGSTINDNVLVKSLYEQIESLKARVASLEAQCSTKDAQISKQQNTIDKLMDRI